jgi:hypothetical protein
MAYDPYEAASSILNLKGQWESADEENRKKITQKAKQHYDALIGAGYSDVAKALQNSNYQQAKGVVDTLGAQGTSLSDDIVYKRGLQGWQNKSDQLWGTSMDYGTKLMDGGYEFDKFRETGAGKSILDYYAGAGEQAGYNQLATGAGANGGNIDSYSQANAIRQNAALRSQGEMAAVNAWNAQREGNRADYSTFNDNMYNLLGLDLTKNQQVFDNKETALNNQMTRYEQEKDIVGYVPQALTYSNNPYLNPDGTVKEAYLTKEFDDTGGFAALLNKTTDPTLRAQIQQARQKKVELPEWRRFAAEVPAAGPQQSAEMKTANADRDLQRYDIDKGYDLGIYGYDTDRYAAETAARAAMGSDAASLSIAAMEASLKKELAQMESPVQQVQAIIDSGLPQEYKDAFVAGLFGGETAAAETAAAAEEASLSGLIEVWEDLGGSLSAAQKKKLESDIREAAERKLKEDGSAFGSWEVHKLLERYGLGTEDALRMSGQ